MAEVTFGPGAVEAPSLEQTTTAAPQTTTNPEPAAAPTPQPSCTSLAPRGPMEVGQSTFILGDFVPEFKDIILPRLNISQALGELGKTHTPGTIVYNNALGLWTPPVFDPKTGNPIRAAGPPVTICCLGFRPTRYVEKVQGGGGMIVNSEDEVRANGGTLDYREWKLKRGAGMRRFEYLADAVIAVKRPESIPDDGATFVFEAGADKYALALWALKGAAYTAAAKGFFFTQRRMGCFMKGGYPSRHVYLTTQLKHFDVEDGKGECWVPVCLAGPASSPEFIEFAKQILDSR